MSLVGVQRQARDSRLSQQRPDLPHPLLRVVVERHLHGERVAALHDRTVPEDSRMIRLSSRTSAAQLWEPSRHTTR
jgi:hypothetical protein